MGSRPGNRSARSRTLPSRAPPSPGQVSMRPSKGRPLRGISRQYKARSDPSLRALSGRDAPATTTSGTQLAGLPQPGAEDGQGAVGATDGRAAHRCWWHEFRRYQRERDVMTSDIDVHGLASETGGGINGDHAGTGLPAILPARGIRRARYLALALREDRLRRVLSLARRARTVDLAPPPASLTGGTCVLPIRYGALTGPVQHGNAFGSKGRLAREAAPPERNCDACQCPGPVDTTSGGREMLRKRERIGMRTSARRERPADCTVLEPANTSSATPPEVSDASPVPNR